MPDDLLDDIDEARGDTPRSQWMQSAARERLDRGGSPSARLDELEDRIERIEEWTRKSTLRRAFEGPPEGVEPAGPNAGDQG